MDYKSVSKIDWKTLSGNNRKFTPSPDAWEDQVFYFLMLDRFSNGKENGYRDNAGNSVTTGQTPMFQGANANNVDRASWEANSQGWRGGTLRGLESKLGYISRLGATAVWVSPVFKQVSFQETYHGYGVQNFLAVDPNFGSSDDLKRMVQTAHSFGIYVILDIILNHAGNIFSYRPDRYWTQNNGNGFYDPRWDGRLYSVAGFNDQNGKPTLPFDTAGATGGLDDAVWPAELRQPGTFTCKGRISNWDYDPEFREGDFCDLKDIHHGEGEPAFYRPSQALRSLTDCYKYWMAFADIDGFRIDTVKHMDIGATRFFTSVIKEYAQVIGKEKFFLIGEITGGRQRAFETLDSTGLDAALGIDDIPDKMEYLVKGYRNPEEYFTLFRNSLLLNKESHVWFRDKVVTLFDDHDQVRKGKMKARFCADAPGPKAILNALALNATTLGIPCIYYGSEQYFDGHGIEDRDGNDVFLRECMFGGPFGPHQSQGVHCFNEDTAAYKEFSKIAQLRKKRLTLRRGRQYLREISGNGIDFGLPRMFGKEIRSIIPWSRILDTKETLVAINTDYDNPKTAWVTIDNSLHTPGDVLTCIYSTDPAEIGKSISVVPRNGTAVQLAMPAGGFVIYE